MNRMTHMKDVDSMSFSLYGEDTYMPDLPLSRSEPCSAVGAFESKPTALCVTPNQSLSSLLSCVNPS
jgi:hypothetical protein